METDWARLASSASSAGVVVGRASSYASGWSATGPACDGGVLPPGSTAACADAPDDAPDDTGDGGAAAGTGDGAGCAGANVRSWAGDCDFGATGCGSLE